MNSNLSRICNVCVFVSLGGKTEGIAIPDQLGVVWPNCCALSWKHEIRQRKRQLRQRKNSEIFQCPKKMQGGKKHYEHLIFVILNASFLKLWDPRNWNFCWGIFGRETCDKVPVCHIALHLWLHSVHTCGNDNDNDTNVWLHFLLLHLCSHSTPNAGEKPRL